MLYCGILLHNLLKLRSLRYVPCLFTVPTKAVLKTVLVVRTFPFLKCVFIKASV